MRKGVDRSIIFASTFLHYKKHAVGPKRWRLCERTKSRPVNGDYFKLARPHGTLLPRQSTNAIVTASSLEILALSSAMIRKKHATQTAYNCSVCDPDPLYLAIIRGIPSTFCDKRDCSISMYSSMNRVSLTYSVQSCHHV